MEKTSKKQTEKPVKPIKSRAINLRNAAQECLVDFGDEPAEECILVWINKGGVKAVALGRAGINARVGMLELAKFSFLRNGDKRP
jgi:hypothetical protein